MNIEVHRSVTECSPSPIALNPYSPARDTDMNPHSETSRLTPRSARRQAQPGGRRHEESSGLRTADWFLRKVKTASLLSPEDEVLLAKRAKGGDTEARRALITANIKLAARAARKKARSGHLNLEDVLSEANVALIEAVDGYDCERLNPKTGKPYRFSTYAVPVIDRHLTRVLGQQSGVVTISRAMARLVRRVGWVEGELMVKLGRTPTDEELAGRLRCSLGELELARRLTAGDASLSGFGWNRDELADDARSVVARALGDEEDDDPVTRQLTGEPGSGGTFLNPLQHDDVRDQHEWKQELLARIDKALSGLSPRDREIFWGRHRAGKDLAELAREHGVNVSRISQIVKKAREILRDEFTPRRLAR